MLKATEAYNCYEEVRNYDKILFIQSTVENGWWGEASPTFPPVSAPVHPFNEQIPLWRSKWLAHCCSSLKSKSIYDAIEGIDCITPQTQREIYPILRQSPRLVSQSFHETTHTINRMIGVKITVLAKKQQRHSLLLPLKLLNKHKSVKLTL